MGAMSPGSLYGLCCAAGARNQNASGRCSELLVNLDSRKTKLRNLARSERSQGD